MNTQTKINDLYNSFCLCNKNLKLLEKYTNLSKATIKKYIQIAENLDIELFKYLDDKKNKLTLEMALYLINNIKIQESQYIIFNKFKKNKLENKQLINNLKYCNICCDNSNKIHFIECCNSIICLDCLSKIIQNNLEDFTFKILKCPFCQNIFDNEFLYNFSYLMKRYIFMTNYKNIQLKNLIKIYNYTIDFINKEKNLLNIYNKDIKQLEISINKQIYGICIKCLPDLKKDFNINNIKISNIEKRCGNDQNQIVVLKSDMFTCNECLSKEKIIIKKCPHCGVNTIRPDKCNFINNCVCGGAWCFVCSSRLPNNEYGHNHHYWIGNGTSAFDDACRVTANSSSPKHIYKICNCYHCRSRKGRPICLEENCNKSAINWKDKYCKAHLK